MQFHIKSTEFCGVKNRYRVLFYFQSTKVHKNAVGKQNVKARTKLALQSSLNSPNSLSRQHHTCSIMMTSFQAKGEISLSMHMKIYFYLMVLYTAIPYRASTGQNLLNRENPVLITGNPCSHCRDPVFITGNHVFITGNSL